VVIADRLDPWTADLRIPHRERDWTGGGPLTALISSTWRGSSAGWSSGGKAPRLFV